MPSIIQQIYKERYFCQINKYTENVSRYYFEALEKIGPDCITFLLEELIDSPDDIYLEFFKLLSKFSEESDKCYNLTRNLFLTEKDPYIITELIVFWCYLKEKRAFDIVFRWLNHDSADVVRAVCAYYFQFGEEGRKLIREKLHQQLCDIKSKDKIFKYTYDKIQIYCDVQLELDKFD